MNFRPFPDMPLSLGGLQDEFNRLVERVWHAGISTRPLDGQEWAPVLDMYEYDDRFVVLAEMPGIDANELDITVLGHTLTIRGEKRRPTENAEQVQTVRSERRYGAFCRTVDLPDGVDGDRLSAECTGGVLHITLPKKETYKPRSVKINVEPARD